MNTLTLIAPVYNEESGITQFYSEVKMVLQSVSSLYQSEILFVVDRSTDASLEVVKHLAQVDPQVKVLSLSSRFGHQASLLAGIDHAQSDWVLMMDSDLQHPPSIIPQLLAKAQEGFEVVYTVRDPGKHTNWVRAQLSNWFYRMLRSAGTSLAHQNAADFRLVSKRVAEIFRTRLRERNPFLRGLFSWIGFRSIAVTFVVEPRAYGNSKYSASRLLRFALDGLVSSTRGPFRWALGIGLALCLLSFFIFSFAFVLFFASGSHLIKFAFPASIVVGFGGLQFIFIGLLGEYVGAILDEVKGRPHYLIEESIGFSKPSQTLPFESPKRYGT